MKPQAISAAGGSSITLSPNAAAAAEGWAMLRRQGLSEATIRRARTEAAVLGTVSDYTADIARKEAPRFREVPHR